MQSFQKPVVTIAAKESNPNEMTYIPRTVTYYLKGIEIMRRYFDQLVLKRVRGRFFNPKEIVAGLDLDALEIWQTVTIFIYKP